jgi:hypothetical protein
MRKVSLLLLLLGGTLAVSGCAVPPASGSAEAAAESDKDSGGSY